MVQRQDNVLVEEIKCHLIEYRETDREIEGQIERLERLKSRLIGIGSPEISDMPKAHGNVNDRLADMIMQKDELDSEIRNAINIQSERRKYFEDLMRSIKKSNEKLVIRMRYFDGESWNGVNDMLFGRKDDFPDKEESYLRRVHQVHWSALNHMAEQAEKNGSVFPGI